MEGLFKMDMILSYVPGTYEMMMIIIIITIITIQFYVPIVLRKMEINYSKW